MTRIPIKRALISVYDKTGIDNLAGALHEAGVEIVSTGSTAKAIEQAGVPVTKVEDLTGFPECLDGRVKTLHPKVHAGLLADMTSPAHEQQLEDLGIAPFQLLVSNLYPFEETVASGAKDAEVIEQIDIGGPAMVRAAAKNHASVAVVTSPIQYAETRHAIAAGGFTEEERRRLAAAAFAHTATYDAAVASWFASAYAPDETARETGWPDVTAAVWERKDVLRYGENPHQRSALYFSRTGAADSGIANADVLHGKAMSYNNYVDADAARRAAYDFAEPCVAIIKHSNPCGIAIGADIADAYAKALACDPLSAYGGVVAANGTVTAAMAAPDDGELRRRGDRAGLRGSGARGAQQEVEERAAVALRTTWQFARKIEFRQVSGGLLLQSTDQIDAPGDDPQRWELKAGDPADAATLADLAFAWRACRAVKSNAILLASGGASVGVGMGQVNRVDSARLAVARAGNRAAGSVAASDAYFPFPDGFEILAEAGVRAVAEPGGSIRDGIVIEAAQAAGVTLYFTGVRHFYH